ncbi:MAG: hypothetical protein ACOYYU_13600 [Chloroflexota bacterium]
MVNTYIYVGVAVLAMFFGYFFGLFEGRGQGYKKRKKEEEQERQAQPDAEPLPAEPAVPPLPEIAPAPPAPPPPSLLRLSQDEAGQLRLDLDDERVNTAALTGDQRKRLIALLTLMRPWLEVGKPPPASPPTPASVPSPLAAPVSRPAPRPVALPVPAPSKEEKQPPEAPQSMVAQIDAILQARLAGTPLDGQGIKLRESPEGSVLVHVGAKVYQAIEEVPDESIKAALRAAIAAWENTFTPGP